MAILEISNVSKNFGGLRALSEVTFNVQEGEILALIGPNGAGKTTLFSIISGFYKPDQGSIKFLGKDITGMSPHNICKLGIGRTFQLVKSFMKITPVENVLVGGLFGREGARMHECMEEAHELLDCVGLCEKSDVPTGNLTLVDLRKLELARSLATHPKLLLLDEIMAGLNPKETQEEIRLVRKIRSDRGITVVWIEHVMRAVMELSERIIVLNYGRKIAEGSPNEIATDRTVIEAYLGEKKSSG